MHLSAQQIRQFEEDGYLIVRNQIPAEDLSPLVEELSQRVETAAQVAVRSGLLEPDSVFEDQSFERRAAAVAKACSDPEWLWQTYFSNPHRRTHGVFQLTRSPALLDAIESILGPEIQAHPLFNVRCKLPSHEKTVVRWHQDIEGLERQHAIDSTIVTAWIPLAPARVENGCMQVIQGSHRIGMLPHGFPDSEGNQQLKAIDDSHVPPGRVVNVELEVGDLLLMTERTVHRSIGNHSQTVRWSFDARFNKTGVPNGRELIPGFVARSRKNPGSVAKSLEDWDRLLDGSASDSTDLNFLQWRSQSIDQDGWCEPLCSLEVSPRQGFNRLALTIDVPSWSGLKRQELTFSIEDQTLARITLRRGVHRCLIPYTNEDLTARITCRAGKSFTLPNTDGRVRCFRLIKVEYANSEDESPISIGFPPQGENRGFDILTVNTSDQGGGAEHIAWLLFKGYQKLGHRSWLAVGDKKTDDNEVIPVFKKNPNIRFRKETRWPFSRWYRWKTRRDRKLGRENFNFPHTKSLPRLSGTQPDVIHLHNLHGSYFDLRVLPKLSRQIPMFWTLHDSWAFTGHCAVTNACSRWEQGCGNCPDLSLPPAVERDATRFNLQRKRELYARSKLYIATPSQWLMERVERSVLAPAIIDSRVIPNGIDLSLFQPTTGNRVRETLNIPVQSRVLTFVAVDPVKNPFKDYDLIRAAVKQLAAKNPDLSLLCLVIGAEAPEESCGNLVFRYLPYQSPHQLVGYYQASDIYLHAAKEENLPTVIMEAMSCGIPVVATATGGTSELLTDHKQGLLVPTGAVDEMARAVEWLLRNEPVRAAMGQAAALTATEKFDQNRMITEYLDWFSQILERKLASAA